MLTLELRGLHRGTPPQKMEVLLVRWLVDAQADSSKAEEVRAWDDVVELRRLQWQRQRKELCRNRLTRELPCYQLVDLGAVNRQAPIVEDRRHKDTRGEPCWLLNDIADFEYAMQALAYEHKPGPSNFGAKGGPELT